MWGMINNSVAILRDYMLTYDNKSLEISAQIQKSIDANLDGMARMVDLEWWSFIGTDYHKCVDKFPYNHLKNKYLQRYWQFVNKMENVLLQLEEDIKGELKSILHNSTDHGKVMECLADEECAANSDVINGIFISIASDIIQKCQHFNAKVNEKIDEIYVHGKKMKMIYEVEIVYALYSLLKCTYLTAS